MNARTTHPHRWLTAADAPDSIPAELSSLNAHVGNCHTSRGRWFAMSCIGEAVHAFVAARFVTTLFIVGATMGVAILYA